MEFWASTACATFWSFVAGLSATVLLLVYGILALVPSGPFHHRDVPAGVVMIVLSGTFIAAVVGALVGFLFGGLLGLPVDVAVSACDSNV